MTPDPDRYVAAAERQCFGKRHFTTKRDAKTARKRYERNHGERLDIYRCPHCATWHLGHRLAPRRSLL